MQVLTDESMTDSRGQRPGHGFALVTGLPAVLALLVACGNFGEPEESDTQETEEQGATAEEEQPPAEEDTDEEDTEDDGAAEREDAQAVPAEPVMLEETLWHFDADQEFELSAEVGPVVVEDELAILPILFESDAEFEVNIHSLLELGIGSSDGISSVQGYDVRLIDTQDLTVFHTAVLQEDDLGGQAVAPRPGSTGAGNGPVGFVAVFQAPQNDTVGVLLRRLGMAADVPVSESSERDLPDVQEIIEESHSLGWTENFDLGVEDVVARTAPLESFRESVEQDIGRLDDGEESTLILASDVLFDIDESELTQDAEATLESAAQQLADVDGGELQIVGHTDNVLDEEYNQTLSEERAEAVEQRLEDLTDLSVFDGVLTEGRSFNDPIASNDSEEGRAQNRRVELHFTPSAQAETDAEGGELPEAFGDVSEYPEAVDAQGFDVSVESVTRVDDVLVGSLRVGYTGQSNTSSDALNFGFPSLAGPRGFANEDTVENNQWTAYAPTVISGGQRYYPLDYFLTPLGDEVSDEVQGDDDGPQFIVPLAERYVAGNSNDPDAYYTATVIWPALDADNVTVERGFPSAFDPDEYNAIFEPWRITDVPVEDANGSSEEAEEDED